MWKKYETQMFTIFFMFLSPVNIRVVPCVSLPNASRFYLSSPSLYRPGHQHGMSLPDTSTGNVLYGPVYTPTYTETDHPCHVCLHLHGDGLEPKEGNLYNNTSTKD